MCYSPHFKVYYKIVHTWPHCDRCAGNRTPLEAIYKQFADVPISRECLSSSILHCLVVCFVDVCPLHSLFQDVLPDEPAFNDGLCQHLYTLQVYVRYAS